MWVGQVPCIRNIVEFCRSATNVDLDSAIIMGADKE